MIVDCHVNIWNAEDLVHPLYDQIAIRRTDAAIPAQADADTLHREMARVDRAIVFTLKYGKAAGISGKDETTAAAVKKYLDKFIGFACVDPTERGALERLQHARRALGLRDVNRFTRGTHLPRVPDENLSRILHSNPLDHRWHGGYRAA